MSRSRPLSSYLSPEDKRLRRQVHAERLHEAVAQLEHPDGFADWLEALTLNPRLSSLNCALAALQAPGEVVDTLAGWNRAGCRISRGQTAAAWITAPGFWPTAAFTAGQARAGELICAAVDLPPTDDLEDLRDALRGRLRAAAKPSKVVAAFGEEARAESLCTVPWLE